MTNKDLERALMNEWPELAPIAGDLPPVDPFLPELLPEAFRPMVMDTAERMSVPLDFPAVIAVLNLAGTVSRRAVIEPMAKDSSWVVTPNLWGGLVANPGEMKSPLISAVCAPVEAIQKEWQGQYEDEMREYKPKQEEHELRMVAYKQSFIAHLKQPSKPVPIHPGEGPAKPILNRIIVNDCTQEALHTILSGNPSGVLQLRDELTGWLASLDKPGREDSRAFYLECWNGNSTFIVDRVGRGTICASICVSMLGGIQPARLRSYLAEAIGDGPGNDGLMQRFQLLVYPDSVAWRGIDHAPDHAAAERVEHAFRKLVEMDSENPAKFKFSPPAQELFDAWRNELESKKLRGTDDHPALIAHLSKFRSLMPSLGLLFELADRPSCSTSFLVSVNHAAQAAAWCEYLESHARRVYSCIASGSVHGAGELSERIKEGKLGREFTERDVYRKGWTGLIGSGPVKQAIETLADAGWIRLASGTSAYQVNPAVFLGK